MTVPTQATTKRPSLSALFSEHLRFVWRTLSSHGVPPFDVEDATQEVFLTAHRRMADWEPARASARTWLYAIATRIAANHRRRLKAAPSSGEAAAAPDLTESLDRVRAVAKLRLVLEQLDPDLREVFMLFEIEELSMKQVAEMVGCPLQTAYTRLYAARRDVALALGEGHRP